MIKVLIDDCGIKLPAEMSIEGDALLITPNEPLHKDEAGECEYIVNGWNDGKDSCIWVAIVKGNISISGGCLCYDTIAGLYLTTTAAITEKFWADKHMGSAEFMRIADEEERKKLNDALAAHGLEFDRKKGELVMKAVEAEWPERGDLFWSVIWALKKGEFTPIDWIYNNDSADAAVSVKGWMFKTEAEAQAKCDELNAAIKGL